MQVLHDQGVTLLHDTRLRVGWSVITLRVFGGRVHLCEPQFAGDPVAAQIDDITLTLRVTSEQLALARALEVHAEPTLYLESIRIAPGALTAHAVRLERTSLRSVGESGWSLIAEDSTQPETWTRMPCFRLLEPRPTLLRALMLPSDYRVSFVGNDLISVVDAADTERWAA